MQFPIACYGGAGLVAVNTNGNVQLLSYEPTGQTLDATAWMSMNFFFPAET